MVEPFTTEQIERLTAEIQQQLLDLTTVDATVQRARQSIRPPPEAQRKAIEQATGQDASTFLARFRQAAHKDMCEEGGELHTQWTQYKDLSRKDLLNTLGGILVGLGLGGRALEIAVVSISVYVLYLGVLAFCAGGE